MRTQQKFGRRIDSIEQIFAFTAGFFARQGIDPRLLTTVDLVVEELFTNMVKYATPDDPGRELQIGMAKFDDGVEVTLTDFGVEAFDITRVPDADTSLPIDQRRPGGLGLHLIRRLVDSWGYEYSKETRESRITFRKALAGKPAPAIASTTGGA